MSAIRDTLASIDPRLPWLTLAVATWAACYAIRRYAPRVWTTAFGWLPPGLPAMARRAAQAFVVALPATIIAATAGGGDVLHAVIGLAAGLAAPVWHHLLRALPIPYQGEIRGPADSRADR